MHCWWTMFNVLGDKFHRCTHEWFQWLDSLNEHIWSLGGNPVNIILKGNYQRSTYENTLLQGQVFSSELVVSQQQGCEFISQRRVLRGRCTYNSCAYNDKPRANLWALCRIEFQGLFPAVKQSSAHPSLSFSYFKPSALVALLIPKPCCITCLMRACVQPCYWYCELPPDSSQSIF